jgi:hypothetical protein
MEIADYDPVRDSALAMGNEKPGEELPLHWFIYRAFPSIHSVLFMELETEDELPGELDLKSIEKELKVFRKESIMEILPLMKDNTSINLKEKGIIFYDNSVEKVISGMIQFFNDYDKTNEHEGNQQGESK